jgi:nicotinamidase-related amidase
VQEEAGQELLGVEGHDALPAAVGIIPPAEADALSIEGREAMVAKGYREITSEPYGILKGVVDANAFVRGTWGAEIVDSLAPAPDDIVVEGKRGLDTFASTNLDFILRSREIKTLAVAGFLTNCCVESTARTGYEKGFSIVALSDCAATLSEEEQRFTFEKNLPMFARILTHTEFLSDLGR